MIEEQMDPNYSHKQIMYWMDSFQREANKSDYWKQQAVGAYTWAIMASVAAVVMLWLRIA